MVTSAQFLLDSESSKHSDFKRLSHPLEKPFAQVDGKINSINHATQTINISRGAITKWNRGPATLDFDVNDKQLLNVAKAGNKITFRFVIDKGDFIITEITHQNKKQDKPESQQMKMEHH